MSQLLVVTVVVLQVMDERMMYLANPGTGKKVVSTKLGAPRGPRGPTNVLLECAAELDASNVACSNSLTCLQQYLMLWHDGMIPSSHFSCEDGTMPSCHNFKYCYTQAALDSALQGQSCFNQWPFLATSVLMLSACLTMHDH